MFYIQDKPWGRNAQLEILGLFPIDFLVFSEGQRLSPLPARLVIDQTAGGPNEVFFLHEMPHLHFSLDLYPAFDKGLRHETFHILRIKNISPGIHGSGQDSLPIKIPQGTDRIPGFLCASAHSLFNRVNAERFTHYTVNSMVYSLKIFFNSSNPLRSSSSVSGEVSDTRIWEDLCPFCMANLWDPKTCTPFCSASSSVSSLVR